MTIPWQPHLLNPHNLLLRWPQKVDVQQLHEIRSFQVKIKEAFPEVYTRTAYSELLLSFPSNITDVEGLLKSLKAIYSEGENMHFVRHRIKIPVCYDKEFAWDQEEVCEKLNMSWEDIVLSHTSPIYTVFAIGFLPGFMYLGGLPEQLHFPRKEQPRVEVPKGAVGIGGQQTGIYPQASPGGWQLIGNCPLDLFNLKKNPPFFAEVGDEIQFVSISKDQYRLILLEEETGIYHLQKTRLK